MTTREQELEDRIRQLEAEVRRQSDERAQFRKEMNNHINNLEHWVNKYFPKPAYKDETYAPR